MLAAKLINNTKPKIKNSGIEPFWESLNNNFKTVAKEVIRTSTESTKRNAKLLLKPEKKFIVHS
jgi:hypothetical protein